MRLVNKTLVRLMICRPTLEQRGSAAEARQHSIEKGRGGQHGLPQKVFRRSG
jgi:hypothetical protein